MGSGLKKSVLTVLNKVVVVKILDEETYLETRVGNFCLEGLNRVPKYPGSVKVYDLYRLENCSTESQYTEVLPQPKDDGSV